MKHIHINKEIITNGNGNTSVKTPLSNYSCCVQNKTHTYSALTLSNTKKEKKPFKPFPMDLT